MIITEIHYNAAGNPIRYQVEDLPHESGYKVTVADPKSTQTAPTDGLNISIQHHEWIEYSYWTYEDMLKIQELLPVAIERIRKYDDAHQRLSANVNWDTK